MGTTTEGYLLSFHRLLLLQKVTEPELQAVTLLNGLFKFGLHVVNLSANRGQAESCGSCDPPTPPTTITRTTQN